MPNNYLSVLYKQSDNQTPVNDFNERKNNTWVS